MKEFAHWYSQRNSEQSNNVLSYLAETVAKKIGSKVLVKTLKNALSKRSWIVIFDGLDEVPNDFKDKVANEVMYFLNDVLVEIDGDVLALCTSRPQGYSGQFAGLDGSVLELSLLDADAAMRCAEPLLKFGQSSDDSDKYIEILNSAILSPNVKELMTTPLQSHIMAVVVREGGRPPEKRWQLFNSFYLVMKKRESQKNFQNPRIAKLLREDDRLLKSVHMRLGFVLHARAERSEGAQTALSKDEFRSLVQAVVTEQEEDEIEQIVADVMEATTERLVLVSTPDDCEQVRFDIRQLQEFFAAEFLYAGVDSVELGKRIETIGGDAHWREVMHFLMSALIENQRITEMAVAVQVLGQLNEGDEASTDKLYRRRMARASLLASRLLIEGVLEQDKKDRQKIKPLLEPLSGIFDLGILRGLSRITPPKSRQWLIELLLDKIETASPREYVGALFLLGWLLPNDHDKSALVSKAFFNIPIGWQEHLGKLWISDASHFHRARIDRQKSNVILSQWVINVAVDILNSPNWVGYSSDLITRLLDICKDEKNRFVASCNKKNIDGEAANAIFLCLEIEEVMMREVQNEEIIDCGILTFTPYLENWINGNIPKTLINLDAKKHLVNTEGVFRLMLTCVWFAEEQSNTALREFIRLINHANAEKVAVLPRPLLALLPIEGSHSARPFNIDHLYKIDTTVIGWSTVLATEQKIQPAYKNLMINDVSESTPNQWCLLATHLPRIAIDFAMNPDGYPWHLQPKFVPELISLILNMPYEASNHFLKWGALQKSQPELFESLKAKVCALPQQKSQFRFGSHGTAIPFELKFPEDIQLLSILAPALITWYQDRQQFMFRDEFSMAADELSLQAILTAYGLSMTRLRDIAEFSSYNQTVRASALALYWLLQNEVKTELDLIREKELYAELVNNINETWLTLALVRGVLIRCSETDADALAFVTYLMERCHDGCGSCHELIELLGNWRERSTAPVNSKQVLKKWLGYDFQAPVYASE